MRRGIFIGMYSLDWSCLIKGMFQIDENHYLIQYVQSCDYTFYISFNKTGPHYQIIHKALLMFWMCLYRLFILLIRIICIILKLIGKNGKMLMMIIVSVLGCFNTCVSFLLIMSICILLISSSKSIISLRLIHFHSIFFQNNISRTK
jgi:hypothetical protein